MFNSRIEMTEDKFSEFKIRIDFTQLKKKNQKLDQNESKQSLRDFKVNNKRSSIHIISVQIR
jgi:hypothetical protein